MYSNEQDCVNKWGCCICGGCGEIWYDCDCEEFQKSFSIYNIYEQYSTLKGIDLYMKGLLDDLEEHFRSPAPSHIYSLCLYDQINWLMSDCEPPYTLQEIEDYLISCQTL